VTRQTEQSRTDLLGPPTRVIGSGRHYTVELRGVTDQNDDGTDRQSILRTCSIGEELQLDISRNNRDGREPLKIRRRTGEELGYVTPLAEVTTKLEEGRKFRVKLAKLYPFRAGAGQKGAVLDFEEVRIVQPGNNNSGLDTKWIVLIGIAVLLLAAGAAKLLGFF
jgi:hypothetical protein